MEITFKGALHLKLHSTTFFATLGLPSVTCGLQGLLRFLPHTMPIVHDALYLFAAPHDVLFTL